VILTAATASKQVTSPVVVEPAIASVDCAVGAEGVSIQVGLSGVPENELQVALTSDPQGVVVLPDSVHVGAYKPASDSLTCPFAGPSGASTTITARYGISSAVCHVVVP
jgi:hypothetical protein